MPALISVALGLLLGALCGGSLNGLREPLLRFEVPILVLFVIQALARGRFLPGLTPGPAALTVWVALSVVLTLMLLASARRTGVALAIVGILLNLIVVLLNGAMRVGELPSGVRAESAIAASGGFYKLVDVATLLPGLSDVMPLPLGGATFMMSPGDISISVAVIVAITGAMLAAAAGGRTDRIRMTACATMAKCGKCKDIALSVAPLAEVARR